MSSIVYEIVEHDGGWAYRVGRSYSETFQGRSMARAAADRAAGKQARGDLNSPVDDEGTSGNWHMDWASDTDRPAEPGKS